MDEVKTVQELQIAIETVRQAYAAARSAVESAFSKVYSNPLDATDKLLSEADEFGPEHAMASFANDPHSLGDVRDGVELPWADTRALLSRDLPPLLESHDQLDGLTNRREALAGEERDPHVRALNIHGTEYQLDAAAGRLRETARPDKDIKLSLATVEPPERSLTEQAQQQDHSAKAQPSRTDIDRGRGR